MDFVAHRLSMAEAGSMVAAVAEDDGNDPAKLNSKEKGPAANAVGFLFLLLLLSPFLLAAERGYPPSPRSNGIIDLEPKS